MYAFEDRENAFENRFVNDETQRFKALARRNKALAQWAGDLKGMKGEAAAQFAVDFVGAQVGKSDDDVAAALRHSLPADAKITDYGLRKRMDEAMTEALASVKGGA